MLEICEVEPGGVGAELDLEPGDRILATNGEPVRDLLDFQVVIGDEEILLEVREQTVISGTWRSRRMPMIPSACWFSMRSRPSAVITVFSFSFINCRAACGVPCT